VAQSLRAGRPWALSTATSGNANPQNDNCLSCNYGQAYADAHKRFVLSGIWQLPVGQGQRFLDRGGVVNVLLGGWQASGIYSLQSGFPFTVLSNKDWSNSLSGNPLPDRICNGNNGPHTVQEWFDTSCFTTAPLQAAFNAGVPTFGNEQRNALIGPIFNNLDFALLKNFSLSERFKLQFRFETFNTFNRANFSSPGLGGTGATIGTGVFGQITQTVNSNNGINVNRDIQFALKLSF
jgi:hypothetical protein